jgi:hypothetical protein
MKLGYTTQLVVTAPDTMQSVNRRCGRLHTFIGKKIIATQKLNAKIYFRYILLTNYAGNVDTNII